MTKLRLQALEIANETALFLRAMNDAISHNLLKLREAHTERKANRSTSVVEDQLTSRLLYYCFISMAESSSARKRSTSQLSDYEYEG